MEITSKILLSFGIGLVAGAVVGVLVAPLSGEETRNKLRKITRDSVDYFLEKAEEGLGATHDILSEMHENRTGIMS